MKDFMYIEDSFFTGEELLQAIAPFEDIWFMSLPYMKEFKMIDMEKRTNEYFYVEGVVPNKNNPNSFGLRLHFVQPEIFRSIEKYVKNKHNL